MGTAMVMFAGIALVMTVLLVCFAPQISSIMHAPKEAFDKTAAYVRICGCGMIVIVAYNLIGCIFQGDRGLQNAAFYSCDRLCL